MKEVIKFFDTFGVNPGLYVKGQTKKKTIMGGMFSSMIYCFTIVGAFFFGQEFWLKLNPTVNTSTSFNKRPEETKYFEDFQFFAGVRNPLDAGKIFYNESIYIVDAALLRYDTETKKVTSTPLAMEKCNNKSFTAENYEVLKNLFYETSYCVKREQKVKGNLTISGLYGEEGYSSIQLRFKQCSNNTEINNCAPQSVIDGYLTNTNLAIFALDNYIMTKNYTHPFQKGYQNYFHQVSLRSFLGFNLFLRDVEFISDSGIIFEEVQEFHGYRHDYMFYNKNDFKQTYFTQLQILKSPTKETYFRTYLKLQNLAAQIGGFIKFISTAAYALIYMYTNNDYGVYLLTSFFQLEEKKCVKQFHLLNYSRTNEKRNEKHKGNVENININNTTSNNIKIDEQMVDIGNLSKSVKYNNFQEKQRSSPPMCKEELNYQLTFLQKLIFLDFCKICRSKRGNLGNKGNNYFIFEKLIKVVKERLDVKNLLKVYYDVDKLKFFLMNEKELKLMDSLTIPADMRIIYSKKGKDFDSYVMSNNKISDFLHFEREEEHATPDRLNNMSIVQSSLEKKIRKYSIDDI